MTCPLAEPQHECETCGQTFWVKWQLQVHQMSYAAVGKLCKRRSKHN